MGHTRLQSSPLFLTAPPSGQWKERSGGRSGSKMKFARYLEETQTPEWKRAYIDYRGLKKKIAAIRQERAAGLLRNTPARAFTNPMSGSPNTSIVTTTPVANQNQDDAPPFRSVTSSPERNSQRTRSTLNFRTTPTAEGVFLNKTPNTTSSGRVYGTFMRTPSRGSYFEGTSPPEMRLPPPIQRVQEQPGPDEARTPRRRRSSFALPPPALPPPALPAPQVTVGSATPPRRPRLSTELNKRRPSLFAYLTPNRMKTATPMSDRGPATLAELYVILSPLERDLLNCLDLELAKVDQFFVAREREVLIKASALRDQLQKLELHRKLFHEYATRRSRLSNIANIAGVSKLMQLIYQRDKGYEQEETIRSPKAPAPSPSGYYTNTDDMRPEPAIMSLQLEPEEYQHARRELKKAVLELYKGVELLHNYRILNLTGFRKALKKYEKMTGRRVSQLYHQEKIQSSAFAESTSMNDLLKELENTYTARFAAGDLKKARSRLRASMRDGRHHFSTFRSGLCIGLSLAALTSGIYGSFQDHIRAAIPEWFALLQAYAALFVLVMFGILIALNILVWSRYRINYVFIFALDVRTALGPHEYLELPAFLFLTLSCCFWSSFSGFPFQVPPTRWPLIWVISTILVMINPLPVLYRGSRAWLLRTLGTSLISGSKGVEFKEFFLGDQLCSMVYSIASLYGIGCAYRYEWEHPLEKCTGGIQWIITFVFSALPSLIRLIQCIKRYNDSGLVHHLVNGGKYTASIVYYFLYLYWRSRGSTYDFLFVIWIVWAVFTSTYSAAWDLIMDWSVLTREAQHPLLRKQLIYVNHAWVYYFAITTNVILRFCWIIYAPPRGPNSAVRSGIVATLEALRRFLWNFFRVENEHLGNADQYRVTREIPLPYQFDRPDMSDDPDQDDETQPKRRLGRRQTASVGLCTIDMED